MHREPSRHGSDDAGPPAFRWARRFLALCGCRNIDEALHDLQEEVQRRRAAGARGWRVALWKTRQVFAVALYELRDLRLRRGAPSRRRRAALHPRLAMLLAARSLGRAPGVALAAALTLGSGFGAAAAIYGVYTGFSRPLPVPDGPGVRRIRVLDEHGQPVAVSGEDFELVGASTASFTALGAFTTGSVTVRAGEESAVRVQSAAMSAETFELLQVFPIIGRNLAAGDDEGVLVSQELWSGYLRGDQEILGRTLRLDGDERVIVGVMPEGYRFPFNQDVWTLLDAHAATDLEMVARLRDGVSGERAAADVERVLESRRADRDGALPGLRIDVLGFTAKRGEGGEAAALATVLALVVALVLVSCSNVSNLLLARALARADLLAVHAALGAGPAQVALQMLVEALLVALAGAVVGLGIAAAAIRYIESTLSGHWGYYWMAVRLEAGVVGFLLALAVLTGLVSGVMPALRLWRADLGEVIRADAGGVVGGGRRRLSTVLLNGQVAFSCLALIIAILLARALLHSRVAAGFPANEVFVAQVALDGPAYAEESRRHEFSEALLESLRSDARLGSVALGNVLPGLDNSSSPLEVEGVARAPEARPIVVNALAVSPSYFEVFNVRILGGRLFSPADSGAQEGVAVVSESFVREYLPASDAIDRRIRLQRLTGDEWLRIVGVVADLPAYEGADQRALARVYVPFAAVEPRDRVVIYRGSPNVATAAVRAALAGLDPEVAVTGAFGQQGEVRVADVLAYVRRIFATTGVLAVLGGVGACAVALIGLYGALAFEVQRRVAEIGVRMALGASRRDVVLHTTRRGVLRVAPGLLAGFLMSLASPLLGYLLGRMNPFDVVVYGGVFAGYLAVAVAATMIPGRRAARLDPVAVLRKN